MEVAGTRARSRAERERGASRLYSDLRFIAVTKMPPKRANAAAAARKRANAADADASNGKRANAAPMNAREARALAMEKKRKHAQEMKELDRMIENANAEDAAEQANPVLPEAAAPVVEHVVNQPEEHQTAHAALDEPAPEQEQEQEQHAASSGAAEAGCSGVNDDGTAVQSSPKRTCSEDRAATPTEQEQEQEQEQDAVTDAADEHREEQESRYHRALAQLEELTQLLSRCGALRRNIPPPEGVRYAAHSDNADVITLLVPQLIAAAALRRRIPVLLEKLHRAEDACGRTHTVCELAPAPHMTCEELLVSEHAEHATARATLEHMARIYGPQTMIEFADLASVDQMRAMVRAAGFTQAGDLEVAAFATPALTALLNLVDGALLTAARENKCVVETKHVAQALCRITGQAIATEARGAHTEDEAPEGEFGGMPIRKRTDKLPKSVAEHYLQLCGGDKRKASRAYNAELWAQQNEEVLRRVSQGTAVLSPQYVAYLVNALVKQRRALFARQVQALLQQGDQHPVRVRQLQAAAEQKFLIKRGAHATLQATAERLLMALANSFAQRAENRTATKKQCETLHLDRFLEFARTSMERIYRLRTGCVFDEVAPQALLQEVLTPSGSRRLALARPELPTILPSATGAETLTGMTAAGTRLLTAPIAAAPSVVALLLKAPDAPAEP